MEGPASDRVGTNAPHRQRHGRTARLDVTSQRSETSHRQQQQRRGFSLTELMVVMGVTVLLAGLLLPTLAQMRENAHRVMSASNLRQIGMAMTIYHSNNGDKLPYTSWLDDPNWRPEELMSSFVRNPVSRWDGFGLLWEGGYLDSPSCFYSPSHHGEHSFERYREFWSDPDNLEPIYTNYHYAGDIHWQTAADRSLRDPTTVLATDGLRTVHDLNHGDGISILLVDNSVQWTTQIQPVLDVLPVEAGAMDPEERDNYRNLWDIIEHLNY